MTRPIKKSKRKSVGWERISVYKVFLLERVRMRVMLGVPAILLVHPIFFKNAKSVPLLSSSLKSWVNVSKAYTNQVDPYVDITHMDQVDP